MKEIGGYFEMELGPCNLSHVPKGILVNSGRHALEYILKSLGRDITTVWIPYYTCEVVAEPIIRCGIERKYYHINNYLEIADNVSLGEGEYIIVNNYFGIKDLYISKAADKYPNHLIVDNAQAFYCSPLPNTYAIYSPRKFFGLPDGGIASGVTGYEEELPEGHSYNRCSHLLKRIDIGASSGYQDFKGNSRELKDESLTNMSNLTRTMLGAIDFDRAKIKRRINYEILHSALSTSNRLSLPENDSFNCPMVYPFMTDDTALRQRLIDNRVYIATYWPNVLSQCPKNTIEYHLAMNILPLPIDQRYGEDEMKTIIKIINH